MVRSFSVLVLYVILLAAPADAATILYVAPSGNDGWSGLKAEAGGGDGPFATLERARQEIRALKAAGRLEGGVTVFVRQGTYCLKKPLALTEEDSGTADAPVVYRAFKDEKPTLIGGQPVRGFSVHRDKILKALVTDPATKNIAPHQLLFAGRRQILARYPNLDPAAIHGGTFAFVDGEIINMYQELPGFDATPDPRKGPHPQKAEAQRVLTYKAADTRAFARPEELEVFIFPRFNWSNNLLPVTGVDREKRELALGKPATYEVRAGDRYYIQNALEELDAPGEWYFDRRTATLYFWPPEAVDPAELVVHLPLLKNVIDVGPGAQFITILGFVIEGSDESAITLRKASHCTIAANTIRNVGQFNGDAVAVDGGEQNAIVGNDIHDTGRNGVSVSGGDSLTLTPASHRIDNNYIHHVGIYAKGASAVSVRGVGHVVSHNLIHDTPRKAIAFAGQNIVMEFNHIHHTDLETEDTGPIGTGGRNWIDSRGSVIRYNFLHDCIGYGRVKGQWSPHHFNFGLYLDDNTGGVDIIGNIVARSSRSALHLHNSRDNRIENNIFVDGGESQIQYSGWTPKARHWVSCLPKMIESYEAAMKSPAWQAMRGMEVHPSKAVLPDNSIMAGNVVRRNIFYYHNAQSKLFGARTFSAAHNVSDENLIFHFGQPILTGQARAGVAIGDNLAPNPGFEEGQAGQMPARWFFQIKPPAAIVGQRSAEQAAGGKASLQMTGGQFTDSQNRKLRPTIVCERIATEPGKCYRLTARLKSDQPALKASLGVQSYLANAYFWNKSTPVTAGKEWQPFELDIRVPAAGEPGYNAAMKTLNIRFDHQDDAGTLWIDDVVLREATPLDEWQSWQAGGLDKNSIVADPLFVDPDRDDYRLRPESPAFKLGFKPIPVEKIGPYKDDLRATWPITEVPGARQVMNRNPPGH